MPKVGSLWRHKKGKYYIVVGECKIEATNEPAVLYRRYLYPPNTIWARPLSEWTPDRFTPGVGPRDNNKPG